MSKQQVSRKRPTFPNHRDKTIRKQRMEKTSSFLVFSTFRFENCENENSPFLLNEFFSNACLSNLFENFHLVSSVAETKYDGSPTGGGAEDADEGAERRDAATNGSFVQRERASDARDRHTSRHD